MYPGKVIVVYNLDLHIPKMLRSEIGALMTRGQKLMNLRNNTDLEIVQPNK
jgi:hypothetical protein